MWLDGIFMADSFYAKYTSLYDNDNTTAWDDIVQQYDNIEEYTRNHTTNLLVHGYDESKKAIWANPETGAAPLVWSRAVGWYMVSLLETIPLLPASHEGVEKLTGYFQTLAEGVLKAQDAATSGWWLIMDFPGREKNYIESSASAMFTFGLLKGVRLGLIDAETYLEPAKKAYQALVDDFVVENSDGTLDWEGTVLVGSLNSNATFEVSLNSKWSNLKIKSISSHANLECSTTRPLRCPLMTTRALAHSCMPLTRLRSRHESIGVVSKGEPGFFSIPVYIPPV